MASALFLSRLGSLWIIIRNTFIDVFEDEQSAEIMAAASADEKKKKGAKAKGRVEWLQVVQGMKLKLIEPLRKLFKGTWIFLSILQIHEIHL